MLDAWRGFRGSMAARVTSLLLVENDQLWLFHKDFHSAFTFKPLQDVRFWILKLLKTVWWAVFNLQIRVLTRVRVLHEGKRFCGLQRVRSKGATDCMRTWRRHLKYLCCLLTWQSMTFHLLWMDCSPVPTNKKCWRRSRIRVLSSFIHLRLQTCTSLVEAYPLCWTWDWRVYCSTLLKYSWGTWEPSTEPTE